MRIAINGDFLSEPQTGAGRYLSQLIDALSTIDGVNEYLLLHYRPLGARVSIPTSFQREEVVVNAPSEQLRKVRWEQRTFPEIARRRDARLLFVPHFAPPIVTTLPVITTIHDVIPFALPEYRPLSALWLYDQLIAQGARRAATILAVSEHAKSEIIRYLNVPAERIVVIPEAPAPQFRPVTDQARLRGVMAKYGVSDPFVLYVGGFDVRKNVSLLVGAFASAAHRLGNAKLRLLISGRTEQLGTSALFPDWRPLARRFGIESRIVSAFVTDEDLPAIYSAASVFVYPSLYEGFGLPPLEAMACGTPVVVSDHPALREVVGAAGLIFPLAKEGGAVDVTRALADQLTALLSNPEKREELRLRGLARVRNYSWSQTAAETSSVFSEIGGTRH